VQRKMSDLTKMWIFGNVREFDIPFEKRSFMTNSTTLKEDNWPAFVCTQIDAIQEEKNNGVKLSVQIQSFAGKNSQYFAKRHNGTSYNWREDNLCSVLDCFFDGDKAKETSFKWQAINDKEVAKTGVFKVDHRVLWGSYGEHDMDLVWDKYYDNEAKYNKLRKIKETFDHSGIFTPNKFSVRPPSQYVIAPVVGFGSYIAVSNVDKNVETPTKTPVDDVAMVKKMLAYRASKVVPSNITTKGSASPGAEAEKPAIVTKTT